MATISVHEAKANLSKLLDRANRGEEVVISKAGVPYARLVPLAPVAPRKAGWLVGSLGERFFEPLPDEELQAWDGES